jgi:hypothetical protein
MADLAGQFFSVQDVLNNRITRFANLVVARLAGRTLGARIAVSGLIHYLAGIVTLRTRGIGVVHFGPGMAGNTIHASLAEVNIPRETLVFTQVLVPHPAAVAGCAVTSHGWGFVNDVPVNKSSAYRAWLADMAIAAGCVARRAMIAKHRLEFRMLFNPAAGIQSCPITGKRRMQAFVKMFRLVAVTGGAGITAPGRAWVGYHSSMGSFHVRGLLAAMAIGTGHFTVRSGKESVSLDKNFLPWLQRSHIAPSANPFGFRAVRILRLGRQGYKLLFVRMTLQAIVNQRLRPWLERSGQNRFAGRVNSNILRCYLRGCLSSTGRQNKA